MQLNDFLELQKLTINYIFWSITIRNLTSCAFISGQI